MMNFKRSNQIISRMAGTGLLMALLSAPAWSADCDCTLNSTAPPAASGQNGKDGKDGQNGKDGKDAAPAATPTSTPKPLRKVGTSEIQEQITLYYYSDVEGLMKLLNPNVETQNSVADSLSAAESPRKNLLDSRDAFVKSQVLVSTRQLELQKLLDAKTQAPKQRDQALEQWKTAEKDLQTKSSVLEKRQSDFDKAKEAEATAEASTETDQAKKDKAIADAKKAQQSAEDRRNAAQCDKCFAQLTRDEAKANYEKLKAQVDSLPETIKAKAGELVSAQDQVETDKATIGRALLIESQAFAEKRGNPIRFMARGEAGASQPALRVDLMAYKDARTIFISGPRNDVQSVKDLIAKFDRPAPQARLGLLTVQMSSKGGPHSAEQMNRAAQIVEENLAATRSQMALAQTLLRDAVNDAVNKAANDHPMPPVIGTDPKYMRRIAFYNPEVVSRLGLREPSPNDKNAIDLGTGLIGIAASISQNGLSAPQILDALNPLIADGIQKGAVDAETLTLLQKQVAALGGNYPDLTAVQLELLGIGLNLRSRVAQDNFRVAFLKANLPDPAATTTLGETLMVLSLANRDVQLNVLNDFEERLNHADLPWPKDPTQKSGNGQKARYPRLNTWFPQLRAALGLPAKQDGTVPTSYDDLTPAQDEIVKALQRVAIERITNLIVSDMYQLGNIAGSIQDIAGLGKRGEKLNFDKALRADVTWQAKLSQLHSLPLTSQRKIEGEALLAHKSEAEEVFKELMPVADWVEREFKVALIDRSILNVDSLTTILIEKPHLFGSSATQGMVQDLLNAMTSLSAPQTTNARIAAADEMLKRIIIAAEDDMDRDFVRPMLAGLQDQVRSQGVSVGVMQRTQVLATNRLIARTDPHGSAQLALGRDTDAIAGLNAILKLGASGALGAASGALGTAEAVSKRALDVAKTVPPEQRPEAYGIETGGEFKILPIIDPSGQALRFNFDYTLNTPVHEPKGTINTQLPVLTQTTNTEVQLSNLEIRSIAEFDATVQLALTGHHSGGIPLLNDLPLLRDVPVIGWFHYTRGRAAHVQKSLMVGQATIYPTIGDITNLLTPLGPRRITDRASTKSLTFAETAQTAAKRAEAAMNIAQQAQKTLEESQKNRDGAKKTLEDAEKALAAEKDGTKKPPLEQKVNEAKEACAKASTVFDDAKDVQAKKAAQALDIANGAVDEAKNAEQHAKEALDEATKTFDEAVTQKLGDTSVEEAAKDAAEKSKDYTAATDARSQAEKSQKATDEAVKAIAKIIKSVETSNPATPSPEKSWGVKAKEAAAEAAKQRVLAENARDEAQKQAHKTAEAVAAGKTKIAMEAAAQAQHASDGADAAANEAETQAKNAGYAKGEAAKLLAAAKEATDKALKSLMEALAGSLAQKSAAEDLSNTRSKETTKSADLEAALTAVAESEKEAATAGDAKSQAKEFAEAAANLAAIKPHNATAGEKAMEQASFAVIRQKEAQKFQRAAEKALSSAQAAAKLSKPDKKQARAAAEEATKHSEMAQSAAKSAQQSADAAESERLEALKASQAAVGALLTANNNLALTADKSVAVQNLYRLIVESATATESAKAADLKVASAAATASRKAVNAAKSAADAAHKAAVAAKQTADNIK